MKCPTALYYYGYSSNPTIRRKAEANLVSHCYPEELVTGSTLDSTLVDAQFPYRGRSANCMLFTYIPL